MWDRLNDLKNSAEDAFNAGKELIDSVIPDNVRQLKAMESMRINTVFEGSMSASNLRITDGQGAVPSTAWCSPSPYPNEPGVYWLNVGPSNYALNLGGERISLLIHESTHAWQGLYGILPQAYILGSAYCQGISILQSGDNQSAYNYEDLKNQQFWEYTTEQQASIVGHWASSGFYKGDWRFRYIRDNIRTGLPNAISTPIEETNPSRLLRGTAIRRTGSIGGPMHRR
jgi:hypothetical protein